MDYKSLSIEDLVKECAKNSDPDAWKEFDRRFKRLIGSVVISVCRKYRKNPLDYVEDLISETYIKLLRKDRSLLVRFEFKPEHENAFLCYLKAAAASVSYDFFRKIHGLEVSIEDADDPADHKFGNPEAVEIMLFAEDVDRILRQRGDGITERKERTIFWLYYRQRFTCKEIAANPTFGLSIKGIESVIHRLTEFVRRSLVLKADTQAAGK